MSIRTTVTLDEDVLARVKQESRSRGASFRETLNDLLRTALVAKDTRPIRRNFRVRPFETGFTQGLNYDDVEGLIEFLEGPEHR